MKSNEINIRDPYILPYDGKYYLYGTRSETAFVGQAYGFEVYVSDDLENWEGPFEVFHRPEGFRSAALVKNGRNVEFTAFLLFFCFKMFEHL